MPQIGMEVNESVCCDDWQTGIDEINSFITLQSIRSSQPNIYTGRPFSYCPWCGIRKAPPMVVDKHKIIERWECNGCYRGVVSILV